MANSSVDLDTDGTGSDCDIDEEPLKNILQCLTNTESKKSTILTNRQLKEVLRKQYDRDVRKMHKLEVDIYLNVMKKFLKEWFKWEEIDAILTSLRKKKDEENVKKVVEEQYGVLVEHLRTTLDLTKPFIDDVMKNIKEETTTPVGPGDVVMEIVSTRDQLNQLFYRTPTSDLSTSLFNIDSYVQSRINLATWRVPSILHMWNVKISVTLNSLVYKREMTHLLKHRLINKIHTDLHPTEQLCTNFQVKTSRSKDVDKDVLLKTFQTVLLMNENNENFSLLNEIFYVFQCDLVEAPSLLNVPAKYRKTMNKYPYIRYLYTDNSEKPTSKAKKIYDLQLEEIVTPMFQITIGKLETTSVEMPSFEVWLVIECGHCNVKFYGDDVQEKLEAHFNETHQNEPEWTCTHCLKRFNIKQLTEQKWAHSC